MNKKGSLNIGIAIVCVFIFIGFLWQFWLGPHIFLKQVDSAHDIIEDTYNAKNAISNYEWFKTQYETIRATEKQIDNTKLQLDDFKTLYGDTSTWDFTTKQEYSRLSSTFLGQKNYYEGLVADYNARSKMANREIFKNGLPFDVDKKLW